METPVNRILNARPDTLDFRDRLYQANLYEVPEEIPLEDYKSVGVPVLDQKSEGACTGFGLATVANYLLRKRTRYPNTLAVSARMFYEMARRYDEWPGEDYSGSSARGAMKGWQKHGVCSEECWAYENYNPSYFNEDRAMDALKRPLGAYYRVNHKDIIAIHTAMAEVGVLYATSQVHEGWNNVGVDGTIPLHDELTGGHAFAIVAYNSQGLWIQNSWGADWGMGGFALVTYDDWLRNGTDVWVARLGAPITLQNYTSVSEGFSPGAGKTKAYVYSELRPHIVSIGNDGALRPGGEYGTSADEVRAIFEEDFPRITKNWKKKRIVLYAHGGLVDEKSALQRVSEYRTALLEAEVYPLAFIWKSDAWTTLTNILKDALGRRKSEGVLDGARDFLLDRLDDALEPLARTLTGKLQWDEMKENAQLATISKVGGARFVAGFLKTLKQEYGADLEIHIIGHSAGSIFHAPFLQLLSTEGTILSGALKGQAGLGLKVETCTLWAPACTVDLFNQAYLPAITSRTIRNFALFTLTDRAEQDDHCGHIYNKSLLYLVSNAFEQKPRIPLFRDGEPILGMEKFIRNDKALMELFENAGADWVLSPNTAQEGNIGAATATTHGGFDDDKATVIATLHRILGKKEIVNRFSFKASGQGQADRRKGLS
ncbi:peptidase C1 [Flavobacterium akiainvivens]|uniref:Peptidase C1 n=1 Tax=Flavobacterium akiainvivens TaxID=1202724 RepID=A0A0M8M771_9FLAO|nr:C1 family peptidase [Flavobacterium akiainvivens]KOS04793.1 peptidase C1 [Flavobacterium akiainvivens]SFQ66215.1 Papain family cysteine protease [Flavobacterium akiainvivens]